MRRLEALEVAPRSHFRPTLLEHMLAGKGGPWFYDPRMPPYIAAKIERGPHGFAVVKVSSGRVMCQGLRSRPAHAVAGKLTADLDGLTPPYRHQRIAESPNG